MPELGKKYTCYSCHTKFYDLGKPTPLCPKCGADQRDAEEAPVYTSSRSKRIVEPEPAEDEEFTPAGEAPAAGGGGDEEEEEFAPGADREEEEEDDDDDEEEY